jgi:hypothetical protein
LSKKWFGIVKSSKRLHSNAQVGGAHAVSSRRLCFTEARSKVCLDGYPQRAWLNANRADARKIGA